MQGLCPESKPGGEARGLCPESRLGEKHRDCALNPRLGGGVGFGGGWCELKVCPKSQHQGFGVQGCTLTADPGVGGDRHMPRIWDLGVQGDALLPGGVFLFATQTHGRGVCGGGHHLGDCFASCFN